MSAPLKPEAPHAVWLIHDEGDRGVQFVRQYDGGRTPRFWIPLMWSFRPEDAQLLCGALNALEGW